MNHRIEGLENFAELMRTLTTAKEAIKVYCQVAPLPGTRAGRPEVPETVGV